MKADRGNGAVDYSLYLVTDRGLANGRSLKTIVEAAVRGGVSCVQLREKHCSARQFVEEARGLLPLLRRHRIPLIINDRLDIALAVNADGIHLGQSDMHINDARRLAGDRMIIGISAENLHHAVEAENQGADYIGISPVFATDTKADTAPPLGLEGVRRIRQVVGIPLVGIGGINEHNVGAIVSAGANGVAVVSAIISAPCAETAAAGLKRQIVAAGRKKQPGKGAI